MKKAQDLCDIWIGQYPPGTVIYGQNWWYTDRTCYGSELDPKYCQVIIERWINYKDGINGDDVIIERDGKQIKYSELKSEQSVEK